MLRGVRGRLLARAREFLHGARRLRQQIQKLEPDGTCEPLAHQRYRLEQRMFSFVSNLHVCNSIDQLIGCQASTSGFGSKEVEVFFRQLLNDETACASYLLGCATFGKFAVVDPHDAVVVAH